jgi:hypothetical protein
VTVIKNVLFAASLLALIPACAAEPADEFAEETGLLGGKADATGPNYTYFTAVQDTRRCVSPLCGGVWVQAVNRQTTRCAEGSADACYVAEIDGSALGLDEQQKASLDEALATGRAVLRGSVEDKEFEGFGNLGIFVAEEAWVAGSAAGEAFGVFTRVEDQGIVCITFPCISLHESKLNSRLSADIAELDLSPSGATEEEIAAAFQAAGTEGGVIVSGYRYTTTGPAGSAKARTVYQFWTRLVPRAPAGACFVGGCSGQSCSDHEGVITTCEWRDEYACYQTATCERQSGGACGWTSTPELDACLASAR